MIEHLAKAYAADEFDQIPATAADSVKPKRKAAKATAGKVTVKKNDAQASSQS